MDHSTREGDISCKVRVFPVQNCINMHTLGKTFVLCESHSEALFIFASGIALRATYRCFLLSTYLFPELLACSLQFQI